MSQPHDPWSTPAPGQGGQQPSSGQPSSGQASSGQPSYGQAPAYGQQPSYGSAPAYGQQAAYHGQGGASSPYGYAPAGPPTKPSTVRTAVILMYVGAALSLLGGFMVGLMRDSLQEEFDRQAAMQGSSSALPADFMDSFFGVIVVISVVFGLIFAGLWIMNAVACSKGRNWGRITGTVLGGLYLLTLLPSLFQGGPALSLVVNLLTAAVVVATIVLLWLRPSNEFFSAAGAARRTG